MSFHTTAAKLLGKTARYYRSAGREARSVPKAWLEDIEKQLVDEHKLSTNAMLDVYRANLTVQLLNAAEEALDQPDMRKFDQELMSWCYESAARMVAGIDSNLFPQALVEKPRHKTTKSEMIWNLVFLGIFFFVLGMVVYAAATR